MKTKQRVNQNKPQIYREPNKSFHQFKIYPTKTFIVKIVSENHFQITQITLDNNHLTIRIIEDDHQIKKIHDFSRKTDIVDQTVEIVSIEITNQDQIQTNLNFLLMPVFSQILEKHIF